MLNALIYTRVSTDEQVANFSLGSQEKECRRLAERKNWYVIQVYREEGASAKTVNGRPELLKLIKFCQKKENKNLKVIVYKYDRWSRNTEQGLAVMSLLAKNGIEVISATEPSENTAMGKAMMKMMLVWAELDNDIKSERTKDGMTSAFNDGYWPWRAPLGYIHTVVRGKKAVILDEQLKNCIYKLFQDAASGLFSKQELVEKLKSYGFEQKTNKKVTDKLIDHILKKKFYFGMMEAKGWEIENKGSHQPIIDKETWLKANENVYKLSSVLRKKRGDEIFPLRRFVLCGNCNEPMTASYSKHGQYGYYHCARKSCSMPTRVPKKTIEEGFLAYLEMFTLGSIQRRLLRVTLLYKLQEKMTVREETITKALAEIANLEHEKLSTIKAVDKGLLSDEEGKSILNDIRAKQEVKKVEISDNSIDHKETNNVIAFAEHFLSNISNLWENLDLPRKKILQDKIFPKKVYFRNGKFGTDALGSSFELIQAIAEGKKPLVTPSRFELL